MNDTFIIFQIAILVMSVVIHEISHGYAAEYLGDPTPRLQGRLTLNPIKHLDLIGSIVVPLISMMTGGFIFGWAKPVQWNPYNVKNRRVGEFLISLAGPLSNMIIVLVFGLTIRFFFEVIPQSSVKIMVYIVLINIVLAIFNLIPIPPLDGSKMLFSILPPKYVYIRESLEKYSFVFFLIFVFVLWRFVAPVVPLIFGLITGI